MAPKSKLAACAWLALAVLPARAAADETPGPRQTLDEAWWTGPLLAPGAGTLPKGHMLAEPYLFDVRPYDRLDGDGTRRSTPSEDNWGSLTYLLYGLTDRVTVGLVPHFGYRRAHDGGRSSGIGVGDLSVQAQYRLTQWREGGRMPTLSVMVSESLPIGRHDRLDHRPNDGFGSGAYATTVGLYGQTLGWTPNGRILRTRLDLSYTRSAEASVRGMSVYGTPAGFRDRAKPGDGFNADLAFEYSATRNWVLALDVAWQRDASTRVTGTYPDGGGAARHDARSGGSHALILAPAVEYNWTPNMGVIVGARIIPAGRNITASVTPAVAFNYVL